MKQSTGTRKLAYDILLIRYLLLLPLPLSLSLAPPSRSFPLSNFPRVAATTFLWLYIDCLRAYVKHGNDALNFPRTGYEMLLLSSRAQTEDMSIMHHLNTFAIYKGTRGGGGGGGGGVRDKETEISRGCERESL